jgi:S-adenosylmethionine uptake transporter
MSADVPSLTVTFVTAVMVTLVFGGLALTQDWTPMRPLEWICLLGATVFIVGAYYFSVQVMRVGEITVAAPFRYTALLWALVLGLVFFGEWPDALTVVGAIIIVAAGLFSLHREKVRRDVDPDVFD